MVWLERPCPRNALLFGCVSASLKPIGGWDVILPLVRVYCTQCCSVDGLIQWGYCRGHTLCMTVAYGSYGSTSWTRVIPWVYARWGETRLVKARVVCGCYWCYIWPPYFSAWSTYMSLCSIGDTGNVVCRASTAHWHLRPWPPRSVFSGPGRL